MQAKKRLSAIARSPPAYSFPAGAKLGGQRGACNVRAGLKRRSQAFVLASLPEHNVSPRVVLFVARACPRRLSCLCVDLILHNQRTPPTRNVSATKNKHKAREPAVVPTLRKSTRTVMPVASSRWCSQAVGALSNSSSPSAGTSPRDCTGGGCSSTGLAAGASAGAGGGAGASLPPPYCRDLLRCHPLASLSSSSYS